MVNEKQFKKAMDDSFEHNLIFGESIIAIKEDEVRAIHPMTDEYITILKDNNYETQIYYNTDPRTIIKRFEN